MIGFESILSASGPRRHEARLKLSSKDSALPILVVEGKQDYRILHQRWNSGPETLRASIKIQYPSGEHTKNGVINELRKNSENPKYHGMVDMDHDFEKENSWDNIAYMTRAHWSHFLRMHSETRMEAYTRYEKYWRY